MCNYLNMICIDLLFIEDDYDDWQLAVARPNAVRNQGLKDPCGARTGSRAQLLMMNSSVEPFNELMISSKKVSWRSMTQWDLTNNAELCFDCSQKKHSGTASCAGHKKDAGARVLWAVMFESRREKHLCLPTCKGLVYAFSCTDFICTSIVSMLVQAGKMAIHVKATHTHSVFIGLH